MAIRQLWEQRKSTIEILRRKMLEYEVRSYTRWTDESWINNREEWIKICGGPIGQDQKQVSLS